jgi:chaperone modulatory protein CbpM
MIDSKRRYVFSEVCEALGIERDYLVRCIRAHWVIPASSEMGEFDQEDLARVRLIHELQEDMGVNDEAIPIILHLLDQIHYLRGGIRSLRQS